MKRNNICRALVAVITVSLLLTGCKGNAAKATDPSDALLATETTAATENTKATTKVTTKPTTKPTTGKTDTTKATEATKPTESQKPVETPKPTEAPKTNDSPKPTNPPATEAPKPTNPPATQPPATEAPKPTNPPETEPPVVSLSIDEAISYGRQYIQSLGAILDTGLAYDDPGYYPAFTFSTNSQSELNSLVIDAIDGDIATLRARDTGMGRDFDLSVIRLDVLVEYDGDGWYAVTVYYG